MKFNGLTRRFICYEDVFRMKASAIYFSFNLLLLKTIKWIYIGIRICVPYFEVFNLLSSPQDSIIITRDIFKPV